MHWNYCKTGDFSHQELKNAYCRLSVSRKAHIDRLRLDADKTRSLAAELLVMQLLKAHYGITDAVLCRRDNGQPYLVGCPLHVSISHCGELVACAISPEPVGIDIECVRPVRSRILHHVCTREEVQWVLKGQPQPEEITDPQVLGRFFEIWTAKEAYFKRQGTGITDLKSVNALSLPCQTHRIGEHILQIL